MKQTPRVFVGGLTGRVFVATRYRVVDGRVEAVEKHDITDQFVAIAAELRARRACPHGDPFCPCQDDGGCHYEYDPVTGTPAAPCPRTGRVGCSCARDRGPLDRERGA